MDSPDTAGKVTSPHGHMAQTGCLLKSFHFLIKHKTNGTSVEATNYDRIFPHLTLPDYAKQVLHP